MNSHNPSSRTTPSQFGYQIPVASNQRPLFRPRPALYLALRGKGSFARSECFAPDQLNRTPTGRIAADSSGLMGRNADFEIIRVPDIIMPIRTSQHIGPECHRRTITRTRPSTSSGRTEENLWPKLLRNERKNPVRPEPVEGPRHSQSQIRHPELDSGSASPVSQAVVGSGWMLSQRLASSV